MAQSTLANKRQAFGRQQDPISLRLTRLGRWLMDGAAAGLGFSEPEDHPAPPPIGMQPYSGGRSRHRRPQRRWL